MKKTGKKSVTTLADRVKRCRRALGVSKAQLALSAGLPRAPVSRYEQSRSKGMSLKILKKLSSALGVSADYLVGRAEDEAYFRNPHLQKLIKRIKELETDDLQWLHELYLFLLEKRR